MSLTHHTHSYLDELEDNPIPEIVINPDVESIPSAQFDDIASELDLLQDQRLTEVEEKVKQLNDQLEKVNAKLEEIAVAPNALT